jgi:CubicO group peptidase (beta-lactamase class C family)
MTASRSTFPSFNCGDPWVTRELTVRDLLTHRSGLAGTDAFWGTSWRYSQADIIRRLRYVQPTASFRSEWQYQNVMYALGGTVIERVAGVPWDAFIRSRIFAPLGMSESEPLVSSIAGKTNVAVPRPINDSVKVVPVRSTDGRPAPVVQRRHVEWMRFILDSVASDPSG